MCEYTSLGLREKQLITHLLNTKKALERAQLAHNKAVERAMAVVEKHGTVEGRDGKAVFNPASVYTTLDTTRLKVEMPELLNEYGKTVNRKATIKVLVK